MIEPKLITGGQRINSALADIDLAEKILREEGDGKKALSSLKKSWMTIIVFPGEILPQNSYIFARCATEKFGKNMPDAEKGRTYDLIREYRIGVEKILAA